jgi:hypothetical protein
MLLPQVSYLAFINSCRSFVSFLVESWFQAFSIFGNFPILAIRSPHRARGPRQARFSPDGVEARLRLDGWNFGNLLRLQPRHFSFPLQTNRFYKSTLGPPLRRPLRDPWVTLGSPNPNPNPRPNPSSAEGRKILKSTKTQRFPVAPSSSCHTSKQTTKSK